MLQRYKVPRRFCFVLFSRAAAGHSFPQHTSMVAEGLNRHAPRMASMDNVKMPHADLNSDMAAGLPGNEHHAQATACNSLEIPR